MLLALLSLVLSVATGLAIVLLLGSPRITQAPLAIISLSIGIGLGMSSCVFVIWLYIAGSAGRGVAAVDLGLLAVLGALAIHRVRRVQVVHANPVDTETDREQPEWAYIAGLLVCAFCLGSAVLASVRIARAFPNGWWDAWAIWNLHARFLFRGGNLWKEVFSDAIGWSHMDYPLLVPATVARSWTYWGRESRMVPALVGMLFMLATAGIVVSGLSILRGKTQALLGGAVLLGTPFFVIMGVSQCADVPLSFFMAAALVLVALEESAPAGDYGLRMLAGTCAGLAVWTKNEGWVFFLSLAFAQLVMALVRVPRNRELKRVAFFLAGWAFVAAIDLFFKATVAPGNDLFANQPSVLHRLARFSRYMPIAKGFRAEIFAFGNWRGNLVALLVIYGVLAGFSKCRNRAIWFLVGGSIALTTVGYFCAYVITPEDLQWHIANSLNRLFLQLWPSVVFLIFLMIQSPPRLSLLKSK